MSRPIEDDALLGDGETAALLSRDGSIDWLCWPRFDDAACFAALLGTTQNGCWSLAPAEPITRRSRRYQDDTLVMETEFETAGGAVRIIDFMPIRKDASALVRIVVGLRGTARMLCFLRLRFDYGAPPPWSEAKGNDMVAKVGCDLVVLRAPMELRVHADATSAEFDVHAGEHLAFVLSYGASHAPLPEPLDVEAALAATQRFWRDWIAQFDDGTTAWPGSGPSVAHYAESADSRADGWPRRRANHVSPGSAGRHDVLGRRDEAVARFERVLAVANDLGLLSEEYDVPLRQLAGNFPQALTHLALVNTALGLSGPLLQRGGG